MSYDSYLAHHGILGMKWGIRRTPEQLGRINGGTAKVYKLHNYKGPLYFISEQDLDGKTLHPRIPQNYLTRNGFEDNTTERVCFSYNPGKCLTAMSSNVSGKTFNVYSPADKHDVYKPNNITVPDADITGELWIKEPVKIKKIGSIKCTGDTGEDGLKYTYGNQEAELYDWDYKWLERSDQSTKIQHASIRREMYSMFYPDELYHHGIKGMHWGVRRYQNADGTLTEAGKKRNGIVSKVKEAKNRYIKGRDLRAIRDNYTDKYVIERQLGRRSAINHIRDKSSFAKANDKMVKKYGKQSLDDIHYADVYEAKVVIGTSLAAMAGITVAAALNW